MSGIQFNRCATNMGKVLKMLEELEPKINNAYSCEEHKEELLGIAYICRVGILDKIENNPSWVKNNLTIRIPTGLFSLKKMNVNQAYEITIGKLLELSMFENGTNRMIESVLTKEEAFYEFERIIPEKTRIELRK